MKIWNLTVLVLAASLVSAACAPTAVGPLTSDEATAEAAFEALTECVREGLPRTMVIDGDDRAHENLYDSLATHQLDALIERLDPLVRQLLVESVRHSESARQFTTSPSAGTLRAFQEDLEFEIIGRSRSALDLQRCGTKDEVGVAVYAIVGDYFARFVQPKPDGSFPPWVAKAGGESRAGTLMLSLVSLRAAGLFVDPAHVIQAISSNRDGTSAAGRPASATTAA